MPWLMGLTIDLGALVANWKALADRAPGARPGAVVKADAYGLGAAQVAPALHAAGARDFFVAQASEGRAIRPLLAPDARIFVLSGHMPGQDLAGLIPQVGDSVEWHGWRIEVVDLDGARVDKLLLQKLDDADDDDIVGRLGVGVVPEEVGVLG